MGNMRFKPNFDSKVYVLWNNHLAWYLHNSLLPPPLFIRNKILLTEDLRKVIGGSLPFLLFAHTFQTFLKLKKIKELLKDCLKTIFLPKRHLNFECKTLLMRFSTSPEQVVFCWLDKLVIFLLRKTLKSHIIGSCFEFCSYEYHHFESSSIYFIINISPSPPFHYFLLDSQEKTLQKRI